MTKYKQFTRTKSDKRISQKQGSFFQDGEISGQSRLPVNSTIQSKADLSLQKHAHLFRNPNILAVQRQEFAAHIRDVYGNLHLKQVIAQISNNQLTTFVQREENTDTSGRDQNETDELDAELDTLLEQIFGKTPKVPAFEAITSTTAGEYSAGELEAEIQRLWRRRRMTFTHAARHAAQANTSGRRGPRATQSPQLQPSTPYALRWAVNLFAADYQGRSDLPDVSALTRRGSPFQQSLAAEFNRVIAVRNPTAGEIRSQIFNATHDLWLALGEGQIGELVITFSGHGGNGSISGVDWQDISPQDLHDMAELARDHKIHIVYILDTCRAGILTGYAQAAAVKDVQESLSNLPEDQQALIQTKINEIKRLGGLSAHISGYTIRVGDAARNYRRRRTTENFKALFDRFTELFGKVRDLGEYLGQRASLKLEIPNRQKLQQQRSEVLMAILIAYGGQGSAINQALRKVAILLDILNDAINISFTRLNERVAASGRS